MMDFTDVHIHLLPGVDDGPETMEETLRVIGMCHDEGIRRIIATSHWDEAGPFGLALAVIDPERTPRSRADIDGLFTEMKSLAAERYPDMEFYLGCEFYFTTPGLAQVKAGNIPTLAGTRYVLTEFPITADWTFIREGLKKSLEAGFLPVLAHTERYEALLGREERIRELHRMGVHFQVNTKNFLRSKSDPRAAWAFRLLELDLIHLVGSDAHNAYWRMPTMKSAYDKILALAPARKQKALRAQLETIFFENPAKLLAGEYL
jgi:protein-tyrosine phosphatase